MGKRKTGMAKKLERAYNEGFEAGKKAEQLNIEVKGYLQGSYEAWETIEGIIANTKGIGPKTQKKITDAIKEHAEKEANRVNGS